MSHDVVTWGADHDVSAAYCLSSSGDGVNCSRVTICITAIETSPSTSQVTTSWDEVSILLKSRDKRWNSLLSIATTISNNFFHRILTWSIGAQPDFSSYCKPLHGGISRTSNRIHNTETQDLEALRWRNHHHPRSQLCRLSLRASQQSATYHQIHHGNWERQQDRLSRIVSYEGTIQTPDQQCLQKINSHKSVLSAWFTPPSIRKTRYC